MSRRPASVLLPLVLALAACGGGGTSAYVAPELDAETLREGPIAVLGVGSLAGSDDLDARLALRQAASTTLRNTREDLDWIDASEVWIALDPEYAMAILDDYRNTARLGPKALDHLGVLSGRARYVWVARIELDLVDVRTNENVRRVSDRVVVDIEPVARREMAMSIDLFDLRTQRLVFSDRIERVETNVGRIFQVEPLQQPPTRQDIDQAVEEGLRSERMPEAPSRVVVMERIVRDAARHLPGQP